MSAKPLTPLPYDSHPDLPIDPDVVQPGVSKWPPHFTPSLQLVVSIGGCFGTLARYGISRAISDTATLWPWATFITNVSGALFLGLLLEFLVRAGKDGGILRLLRLGIGTGFIGAFTTYSTLAVETDLLLKSNHILVAVAYIGVSVISGIIMSALGIRLAARWLGKRTGNQA